MRVASFSVNGGMVVAAVLLAGGGTLMLTSANDPALHAAGLGVVILAGAVYLAARVAMLLKDRRR